MSGEMQFGGKRLRIFRRQLEFAALPDADQPSVEERLARLEKAVATLAWWLVQSQSGLAERDAQGIEAILRGEK